MTRHCAIVVKIAAESDFTIAPINSLFDDGWRYVAHAEPVGCKDAVLVFLERNEEEVEGRV